MNLTTLLKKRLIIPTFVGIVCLTCLLVLLVNNRISLLPTSLDLSQDVPQVPQKQKTLNLLPPAELKSQSSGFSIKGLEDKVIRVWRFGEKKHVWNVEGTAKNSTNSSPKILQVTATGNDPRIISPLVDIQLDKWQNLRVEALIRTQQSTRLQLFADNGDGFSNQNSNTIFVDGGWVWRKVEIPLSDVKHLVKLRLDPGNQSQYVELSEIKLIGSEKEGLINVVQQSTDENKFVWFRDAGKDIAMGVQIGNEKDASWGVRFHGKDLGPTEYTCFPDDILVFQPVNGTVKTAYAAYLDWQKELSLSTQNAAKAVFKRNFNDPKLYRYIEPKFLERVSQIPVDLEVTHSLEVNQGIAWTTVKITNRDNKPARINWIWQDAAYHWLENTHLDDVHLISSSNPNLDSISVIKTNPKENEWIASADFKHQVGFALSTTDPGYVLQSNRYLYIEKTFSSDSLHLPLRGNDRFLLQEKPLPIDKLLDKLKKDSGKKVSEGSLKNRSVVLDFGTVKPGKTVTRQYARIFLRDFKTPSELTKNIQTVVENTKIN
ncbi:hypothetical protein [Mastigocoleus testarum]|uniref:Uncharacterized protein n=1 Tax=Mastigocoleus testarum BC008 TaxID=371196 RepID=A0A0V7ZT99_9CYAN|nr:hypothetical protein [Mastigocoleus testarum]KST67359.1 hypothetical protein BC008_29630 [Mastigocoleus testarum BC008]